MRILFPVICFLLMIAGPVFADSLTMTTYYPAPSGNYVNLTATGQIRMFGNNGCTTYADCDLVIGDAAVNRHDSSFSIMSLTSALKFIASGTTVTLLNWDGQDIGIFQTYKGIFTGRVGIGITAPTYVLQVNGQPAANGYTAWTNYSDARLKENIADMIPPGQRVLDKIGKLRPVTFNYNALTGYDDKTRARRVSGFIAQELQPLFPEMVGETTINGGKYLDTDLSNLPLYLVVAVKELRQEVSEVKVDALKALKEEEAGRLKDLRAENDALRKEMNDLRVDFEKYRKRHR